MVNNNKNNTTKNLMDFIREYDPKDVAIALYGLPPFNQGILISQMSKGQAATVLQCLELPMQVQILREISCKIEIPESQVIEMIDDFRKVLNQVKSQHYMIIDGTTLAADILGLMNTESMKNIIDELDKLDIEKSMSVKDKMLLFEDVVILDDKSMQRILREIDVQDIALACKGCSSDIINRFASNMSETCAKELLEYMEFIGPVKVKDVYQMQEKILSIIKRLNANGEIYVPKGKYDELVM